MSDGCGGHLALACVWLWLGATVLDAVWVGRERKCEVLDLAMRQLWSLISSVPDIYRQQCLTKPPEVAAGLVLNYILEQRKQLGRFAVDSLGIRSWNSNY